MADTSPSQLLSLDTRWHMRDFANVPLILRAGERPMHASCCSAVNCERALRLQALYGLLRRRNLDPIKIPGIWLTNVS